MDRSGDNEKSAVLPQPREHSAQHYAALVHDSALPSSTEGRTCVPRGALGWAWAWLGLGWALHAHSDDVIERLRAVETAWINAILLPPPTTSFHNVHVFSGGMQSDYPKHYRCAALCNISAQTRIVILVAVAEIVWRPHARWGRRQMKPRCHNKNFPRAAIEVDDA